MNMFLLLDVIGINDKFISNPIKALNNELDEIIINSSNSMVVVKRICVELFKIRIERK